MCTLCRRALWLGLIGGGGYLAWNRWRMGQSEAPAAAPEWPPLIVVDHDEATSTAAPTAHNPDQTQVAGSAEPLPNHGAEDPDRGPRGSRAPNTPPHTATPEDDDAAIAVQPLVGAVPAIETPPRWVEPDDRQCPVDYPIKANDNSGIYHVPGGRFYDRTVPERCYADPADAEGDGYRPAKA